MNQPYCMSNWALLYIITQKVAFTHEKEIWQILALQTHCTKNAPVLSINFSQTQVRCSWINLNQFSSVTQSCPTLCDSMNHSTPGLPVHHQLPESSQTHVRRVGDAIQPSHPLSSPSPPALSLSQNQGIFKWISSSHQMAKLHQVGLWASTSVLPTNTQDWSPLGWTGWISLQSKGLSRVFSNTTVQNYQFFGTQLSL